jgi:integrase
LRAARSKDRSALWVIKDREREISTGYGESDIAAATQRLAEYMRECRQPSFGQGDPDKVLIGECLSAYGDQHGPTTARPEGLGFDIDNLNGFFGAKSVSELTKQMSADYVAWRCAQTDKRAKRNARNISPSTAKRELVSLSAALNWCIDEKKLSCGRIKVALPDVAERRERWLTRNEVAALLWGALGFKRDGTRDPSAINRHVARFILIALYTGTRHTAILALQWFPNTTGGWFDLDTGILYRRPQEAIETNKRRKPTPIPQRLMPHLRRWRRLSTQHVIEFDGQRLAGKIRTAWEGTRAKAGLGADVTPHVLKHSCATLLLQGGKSCFEVAGLLGTTEKVIQDTYGHHAMGHLRKVANDVWSRGRR